MPLNLISDAWIPVLRSGGRDVIRPDQIAEPDILSPDWPRADLDLACLEFLIGLVYLAAPPRNVGDWRARRASPGDLRAAMAPLAPAFDLGGEGPRFLQDFEPLEGEISAPDLIFIDSAGDSTAKKNADLMVHRGRYATLDLPLAAMALYAFQQQAPAGGAGNRTSMRGGGPMVTLVRPRGASLWAFVWANVPEGSPLADLSELPWMRPTRTSKEGEIVEQPAGDHPPAECFFGMPRRLRLEFAEGRVAGVTQRPHGTNYGAWRHPLSPYYAPKVGETPLPRHPKPGRFSYRNWQGIVLGAAGEQKSLSFRAECVSTFGRRAGEEPADVILGGWAMSNMSPLDFVWAEPPLLPLDEDAGLVAADLVLAANVARAALNEALRKALGLAGSDGAALDRARDAFFAATEPGFEAALRALVSGSVEDEVKRGWHGLIRRCALTLFNDAALDGIAERAITPPGSKSFSRRPTAQVIIAARVDLLRALHGKKMTNALGMELRAQKEEPA